MDASGIVLLIVALAILFGILTWADQQTCPVGGWHDWHYTGHYLDLAEYQCPKCGGTKQELADNNDIIKMEYDRRMEEYREMHNGR
jgi:hypothetical protein